MCDNIYTVVWMQTSSDRTPYAAPEKRVIVERFLVWYLKKKKYMWKCYVQILELAICYLYCQPSNL